MDSNYKEIQKKEIVMEKLAKIQKELNAPKNQRNNFGGYNYRSAEDILEAVKPLLNGAILTLQDDIVMIGERYYVKATATFTDGEFTKTTTAFAREPENKKGMDESQITGTASSYARKYALNGLFCIDDNKDADTDEHKKEVDNTPKSSIEDVIKGMDRMTVKTVKQFYAKAIELYGKETPEYKQWVKVWADKKEQLEQDAIKQDLKSELDALDQYC